MYWKRNLVSAFVGQVILLSATMPQDVLEVTKRFMREPIRILVKKEELTLEGIRQFYVEVEREVSHLAMLLTVECCMCALFTQAYLHTCSGILFGWGSHW